MRDAQAGIDDLGEGQRRQIAALRFDAVADHAAVLDIESAGANQVLVDDGVEVAVVDDVIDVAVDVVVHPAGRDGKKMRVVGAGMNGGGTRN